MKFNDFPYQRPDMEFIENEFNEVIQIIKNANNPEEQFSAISRINKIRKTFDTMSTLCQVRSTIDTRDEFYEKEQDFFDDNQPLYANYETELSKAIYNSRFKEELIKVYGSQLFALIEASIKSFSPEIIEDLKTENRLLSEYRKLTASAQIPFDGKINNLSQMGPYYISVNRNIRRSAEAATMAFFEENEDKFDEIYDLLVETRTKMAKKLGFDNYIDLGYLRLGRTDYDSSMVESYRNQVRRDLVPLASKIIEAKGKRLQIKDLKSYDLGIDFPTGNPKPKGSKDDLVKSAQKMYKQMSKETGEFFEFMLEHELMDLEAKKGKSGGGYCTYLFDYRAPFIFSNFNGTSGDVDVLTHEAGHAFQVYSSRDYEVLEYIWPTLEACEIHSMSMEFFAWPWMELFFGEDAERYRYHHLTSSITFIPYGVLVDHFQHEVYQNPGLSKEERKQVWRRLEKIYLPYKIYENGFLEKGTYWLRQSHIFQTAFYYIDYTLAQVCAHQYWIKDQKNHNEAWESYLRLCEQGGSKSFLELLEVAGLNNPFDEGTIKRVASKLGEYLDSFDQSKLV